MKVAADRYGNCCFRTRAFGGRLRTIGRLAEQAELASRKTTLVDMLQYDCIGSSASWDGELGVNEEISYLNKPIANLSYPFIPSFSFYSEQSTDCEEQSPCGLRNSQ